MYRSISARKQPEPQKDRFAAPLFLKRGAEAEAAPLPPQCGKKAAPFGFRRLLAIAAACWLLVVVAPHQGNALDAGQGAYLFKDPETAKEITVWYHKPHNFSADAPIVMVLHGMSRNADAYRDAWKKHAEKYGFMILAPEFSKELFPGNAYARGNYYAVSPAKAKRSGTSPLVNPKEKWTFRAPDKIFAHFARECENTAQKTYYLYGHSAGAQFVHRMLLLVPENNAQMALAANAGVYMLPDLEEEWMYGVKGVATESDVARYLALPLVVLAGEKDVDPESPGLLRGKMADRQGTNRLERAKFFYAYGSSLAKKMNLPCNWRLQTVPGAAHSNKRMASAAAALIAEDMAERNRKRTASPGKQ